MRELALICINGFLLSVVLILAMKKIAARFGFVDIPTARKDHSGRVPMVGAAVFVASAAADYVHGVILPVDGGWLAR